MNTLGTDGRAIFPSEIELRFHTTGRKSGESASRFAPCSKATTVGEFYELHPGSADYATQDLRNDLTRPIPLCVVPGFTPTKDLRIAPPRPRKASRAKGVRWSVRARAARVSSVKGVGADVPLPATEQALLQRFAQYEKLGATPTRRKGMLPAGTTRGSRQAVLGPAWAGTATSTCLPVRAQPRRSGGLPAWTSCAMHPGSCEPSGAFLLSTSRRRYWLPRGASVWWLQCTGLRDRRRVCSRSCSPPSAARQQRGERATGPSGARRLRARSIGCSSRTAASRSSPRGSAAT